MFDKEYAEFLREKRVVVVGPAPSIIGTKQHDLIESYDIVTRLNKGFYIPEELRQDIGSRTDIIYNCLHRKYGGDLDIDKLKGHVQWVCCSYPVPKRVQEFRKKNENRIPFHVVNEDYHRSISQMLDCRLNTGMSAIIDLLFHDIAELYITGITFFNKTERDKGVYYPQYRKPDKMPSNLMHKPRWQFDYFKRLYKNDRRIACDEVLEKLVGMEKDGYFYLTNNAGSKLARSKKDHFVDKE